MATIRPLERADLPSAARLLRQHLHGSVGLHEAFLSATLLDHPWADPEITSLVAADDDDGAIVGLIGAQVRRMRLGDRTLRGVCCAHLVVAPQSRQGATGAVLLRRLFAGPQDFTWSETASDVVLRMWRVFGGFTDSTRAFDWMLVLRPVRWASGALSHLARERHLTPDLVPVRALPLQAAGPRLLGRAFPPLEDGVTGEATDPSSIVEHSPGFAERGTVRPDHDHDYLEHVFALIERAEGALVRRLVRRNGDPIGWYAYLDRGRGASRVLHLAALDANLDAVMGELVEHSRHGGQTVIGGRFEPRCEDALRNRLAVLGVARRPVVYTKDAEVRGLIGSGAALISQLDGEWYAL